MAHPLREPTFLILTALAREPMHGYGIAKRSVEKGSYEVLIGEAPTAEALRKTQFGVDVLPSNTRLAGAAIDVNAK